MRETSILRFLAQIYGDLQHLIKTQQLTHIYDVQECTLNKSSRDSCRIQLFYDDDDDTTI